VRATVNSPPACRRRFNEFDARLDAKESKWSNRFDPMRQQYMETFDAIYQRRAVKHYDPDHRLTDDEIKKSNDRNRLGWIQTKLHDIFPPLRPRFIARGLLAVFVCSAA
jgi:hypothetical protein